MAFDLLTYCLRRTTGARMSVPPPKKTVLVLSKSKFQVQKEEREARARESERAAAAELQSFAASFAAAPAAGAAAGSTFVRGGVIQRGAEHDAGGAPPPATASAGGRGAGCVGRLTKGRPRMPPCELPK